MKRFLVLAMMVLMPATAGAQVAVLGFEYEAGAEDMAKWVTQALRHWVKARGIKLGPEQDAMEVKLVYGCEEVPERPACMAKIARAMEVNRLVFGQVRRVGNVYAVAIRSLDMRRPKNLETLSERVLVEGASYVGVKNIAGGWLDRILGKAVTGTLVITGTPGAVVTVNGQQVGPLPPTGRMELNLPKGEHKVSLAKEGFQTGEQTVNVRVGRTEKMKLQLKEDVDAPITRPVDDPPVVTDTDPVQDPIVGVEKKKRIDPKIWWQVSFYGSAGVAAALLVASIFTGRKVGDLENQKTRELQRIQDDTGANWVTESNVCSVSQRSGAIDDICSDGKRYANMTNAFLITGGLFAAAAGVLSYFAFIRDYEEEESPEPAFSGATEKTKIRVSANPIVHGKSGAGVNLRLDF